MIVFYVLCLLYVLSTATVVCDLINIMLENIKVSKNYICNLKNIVFLSAMQDGLSLQIQIDTQSTFYCTQFVQSTVNGCCDLIAQFILVRINHCTYHPF